MAVKLKGELIGALVNQSRNMLEVKILKQQESRSMRHSVKRPCSTREQKNKKEAHLLEKMRKI